MYPVNLKMFGKRDNHYVLQIHLFNILKVEHVYKGMIPVSAEKPLVSINLLGKTNESNTDDRLFFHAMNTPQYGAPH